MRKLLNFLSMCAMILCFQGCTYSMIMTDTHGTATDVVDDTNSTTADVKPSLEIPLIK